MLTDGTFGGVHTLDLLEALRAIGADVDGLCATFGLDRDRLRRGERVAASRWLELLGAIARREGDGAVGLHAGRHVVSHDSLAFLLLACATLEEGLRKAAKFAPFILSTLRARVTTRADLSILAFDLGDRTLARSRLLVGYVLMTVTRTIASAADGPLVPRAVHVEFPDPGDAAEARAFACPVSFGRPETCLVFTAADLARPPRIANPRVAAQLEKLSATLVAEMDTGTRLPERVAAVSREALARGIRPERHAVARRLGMSDRTLQRALEREGMTFKQVRDGVVREAVVDLLADPAVKIEAVALNAGFARAPAFVKAFKRWTGRTPTAYRDEVLNGDRPG